MFASTGHTAYLDQALDIESTAPRLSKHGVRLQPQAAASTLHPTGRECPLPSLCPLASQVPADCT